MANPDLGKINQEASIATGWQFISGAVSGMVAMLVLFGIGMWEKLLTVEPLAVMLGAGVLVAGYLLLRIGVLASRNRRSTEFYMQNQLASQTIKDRWTKRHPDAEDLDELARARDEIIRDFDQSSIGLPRNQGDV